MKIGLFSDVHANAEAFRSVLDALKREQVDRYVFIGDIVGYGADPGPCIRMLRELTEQADCLCVAGNHDQAVCGLSSDDRYTRYAKEAVEWTKTRLDPSDMGFLSGLPLVVKSDGLWAVHASLDNPGRWSYILDIDDAYPNFKIFDGQVCFTGHSHKPIVFTAAESVDWSLDDRVPVVPGTKYIVNVGSVGQPRDGNPMSSFAVYDTQASLVEIRRVAYDVASAQARIIDSGLPPWLAERLKFGK